jgi:hypothetical protein
MDLFSSIADGLANLGLGIASNAAYDFLKKKFAGRSQVSSSELQGALNEFLIIHKVNASAATVMNLLASRGYLQVTQSKLHANDALSFGANAGANFLIGHGTTTTTSKTAIEAGHGAFITGSGGAVQQNADGSISFHVGNGPNDSISFMVPKK